MNKKDIYEQRKEMSDIIGEEFAKLANNLELMAEEMEKAQTRQKSQEEYFAYLRAISKRSRRRAV
jgi:hypothetical protein